MCPPPPQPPPLLPILAPRIPGLTPPAPEPPTTKDHTEAEWEEKRALIEQLYLGDNKKLAQLMTILETRHNFAATQQMYKKRLKKWNIRKRAYRKTDGDSVDSTPSPLTQTSSEVVPRSQTPSQDAISIITPSRPAEYAGLEMVLNSVFSWSTAKLDSQCVISDPMSRYLANPNQPPIQDSRTMYRTFELVFDLWNRGQGDLSGLAARKGFYCLEFVLTDDHPDLVWHVLDTVYDMVDRGHLQLLTIFLPHATELAHQKLPASHPLLRILQQLRDCDFQSDQGRKYICHLLRQAWLRNVDLLGEHIGSMAPRHLWLYEQLIWDGRTRLRKDSGLARRQEIMEPALGALGAVYDSTTAEDDADRLRVEALMLEFTQMDLGDEKKAEGMALDLLQRTEGTPSRSNARFQAYARKMLARLQEERQDLNEAEDNLRHAIVKREDAHGASNDLRVIRDMWVLAGHLQKVGKVQEAEITTNDAISRAQRFLGTVQPVPEDEA